MVRYLENPFKDLTSADIDRNQLLSSDGSRLAESWDSRIKQCILMLNAKLDVGVSSSIDKHDVSVYTGNSGIALCYFNMFIKQVVSGEIQNSLLQKALNLTEPSLKRLKGRDITFLCGDAGPLAVSAVLYYALGLSADAETCVSQLMSMAQRVLKDHLLPDELLYGRCGYLYSLLFVMKHLDPASVDYSVLTAIVNAVVDSGKRFSSQIRSSCPLMYSWYNEQYLGAAHGMSGIYFMLMRTPGFGDNEPLKQIVLKCINYMLTLKYPSGNYPAAMEDRGRDELVHWCHGAPGFAMMFLEAYKVYGIEAFLAEARSCADVIWQRGLLKKGYGLCHGVAGNGYVFLMLYKETGELKQLYRALKFAEFIFGYGKHGCRVADRPFSLFEGMAGTIYYLTDLLQPSTAEFPGFY